MLRYVLFTVALACVPAVAAAQIELLAAGELAGFAPINNQYASSSLTQLLAPK